MSSVRALRINFQYYLIFFVLLIIGPEVVIGQEEPTIKVETTVLNIPVLVTDKSGRPVRGLTKEDFQASIDETPQTIDFFDDKGAVNIAIIIDAMSNTSEVLDRIRRDAQRFTEQLGPEDRAVVIRVDPGYRVVCPLTSDRGKLRAAIGSLSAGFERARTIDFALHQAIFDELAGLKGRKAVVIFGDPDSALRWYEYDPDSHYSKFIREFLSESDAAVYPIFYQTSTFPRELVGKTLTLDQLLKIPPVKNFYYYAALTGGRFHAAGADNFKNAFTQILDEIRSQYVVGLHVGGGSDSNMSALSLKTTKPELIVRTKQTVRIGNKDERKLWVERYRNAAEQSR